MYTSSKFPTSTYNAWNELFRRKLLQHRVLLAKDQSIIVSSLTLKLFFQLLTFSENCLIFLAETYFRAKKKKKCIQRLGCPNFSWKSNFQPGWPDKFVKKIDQNSIKIRSKFDQNWSKLIKIDQNRSKSTKINQNRPKIDPTSRMTRWGCKKNLPNCNQLMFV
jgi:intein/homing endonuclease